MTTPKRGQRIYSAGKRMCGALAVLMIIFSSCGYSLHGKAALPSTSIYISKIVNKTYEPRLEDRMYGALTNELVKQGFVIDRNSSLRIEGTINTFTLKTLSEKAGVAVEYEVVVRGRFTLRDASGKERELKNRGVFIVSFTSTQNLQAVIALKEEATERALRDLSSEIVSAMLYGDLEKETKPSSPSSR